LQRLWAERGISSARDCVIEPLAIAILVAELGHAWGDVEFAQSSIDPVSGRVVPLAACARLGVDGSHEPHRQANGK
jgi:hypothetical protein